MQSRGRAQKWQREKRRGLEKGEYRAVDRSPDWGGKGAVQKEVSQGIRGLTREETATEEAVGVGGAAAVAYMVGVMQDAEEGVPG